MSLSIQMDMFLLNVYLKLKLLIHMVFVFSVVLADANLFIKVFV